MATIVIQQYGYNLARCDLYELSDKMLSGISTGLHRIPLPHLPKGTLDLVCRDRPRIAVSDYDYVVEVSLDAREREILQNRTRPFGTSLLREYEVLAKLILDAYQAPYGCKICILLRGELIVRFGCFHPASIQTESQPAH